MVWNLDEALAFLRPLWPKLQEAGWHAALTGSVLYRGESGKDLDIVMYPRKAGISTLTDLYRVLKGEGLVQKAGRLKVKKQWTKNNEPGYTDTKHVEVWVHEKRRIDLIIWPSPL